LCLLNNVNNVVNVDFEFWTTGDCEL
jgi:hypothetical protein